MAKITLLKNLDGVPLEALDSIAEAAQLPAGHIALVVGEPTLSDDYQALSIPWAFRSTLGTCGLDEYDLPRWDCGVIVGTKWSGRQGEFPAYFAYLLGHEFGHAHTVLTHLWLAVYEGLIFDVAKVSERKEWRWDELPHEIRYDRFGLAVAEATHGLEQLRTEVDQLLTAGTEQDEDRLRKLLALEPRLDLDGLRQELAEFARPFKAELLEKWQQDIESGVPGLTKYLKALDALWKTA